MYYKKKLANYNELTKVLKIVKYPKPGITTSFKNIRSSRKGWL
jgi:hypothetical protein